MARVTNRTDKKDLQPGVKAQTLDKMSRAAQEAAEGGEKRSHEDRLDPMRDHTPGHLGYSKANLDSVIAPGPNPVSKSNIGLKEQTAPTANPARREPPFQVRNAPKRAAKKSSGMKADAKKSKASKKSASGRASTASKTASKKRKPTMRAQQSKASASKSASGMIGKAMKSVRGAAKKIAGGTKTSGTRTGRKVSAASKTGRKSTAAGTRSASSSASTRSRRTASPRRTTMH